jgi:hypothetical protein
MTTASVIQRPFLTFFCVERQRVDDTTGPRVGVDILPAGVCVCECTVSYASVHKDGNEVSMHALTLHDQRLYTCILTTRETQSKHDVYRQRPRSQPSF